MELEDLDEELEEADLHEEEESLSWKEMPLWQKLVIFCIMFVLAAVIATILWNLTPKGENEGGQVAESTAGESLTVQYPESTQMPTSEPTAVPTPEPTEAPTPEPTIAPTEAPTAVPTAATDALGFREVAESVTPKDVINLRSDPSTADDTNIVVQAMNGQVLSRIGVNENTGWSRIDYNGQILYAVSQYLSEDLSYKTPVEVTNPNRVSTIDGRVIVFADCDDWITPKEYVNLRTEPSTTEGNATVSCQLNYGEKVHRTGYSADSGWSRVEYNGQVLYVVSSYMNVVTE